MLSARRLFACHYARHLFDIDRGFARHALMPRYATLLMLSRARLILCCRVMLMLYVIFRLRCRR